MDLVKLGFVGHWLERSRVPVTHEIAGIISLCAPASTISANTVATGTRGFTLVVGSGVFGFFFISLSAELARRISAKERSPKRMVGRSEEEEEKEEMHGVTCAKRSRVFLLTSWVLCLRTVVSF